MKYLDDEWYQAHIDKIQKTFATPGKANTELVEVYNNVWGIQGKTLWIHYVMVDGQLASIERGEGEDYPEGKFRCFGDYSKYVQVYMGKLDPKMGILGGAFKLEGGLLPATAMLPTYMKLTECKRFPGLEL